MGLVTVTLTTPDIAINCGGPAFTASDGTEYQADAFFSGGNVFSTTDAIAGTEDDPLYQTLRFGAFSYNIPTPSGDYEVTLRFAEIFFTEPGERVFDVVLEGVEPISGLDLIAAAGHDVAHDITLPVSVSGGSLDIAFVAGVNNPVVSAILVKQAQGAPSGDPTLWDDGLSPAWDDGTDWLA